MSAIKERVDGYGGSAAGVGRSTAPDVRAERVRVKALVAAYAVFDKERLMARPGERLCVACVTDESEKLVVAVPAACVVRVGLEPTVFVRDEHAADRFAAVKVTLGRTNGGWTEVAGLPDDEDLAIAREGAYELKIALSAQAGGSTVGHFHADGTFHDQQDH